MVLVRLRNAHICGAQKSQENLAEKEKPPENFPVVFMVGVTGFEPMASWSRTKRTTKLCHTPAVYFCAWADDMRLAPIAKVVYHSFL